jgi:sRNA-binding regulator protein Hfq
MSSQGRILQKRTQGYVTDFNNYTIELKEKSKIYLTLADLIKISVRNL